MAPAPTLAATTLPTPSGYSSENGSLRFSASTIAAVALGVAMFFIIIGIVGYCFWARRQRRCCCRHDIGGSSCHWAPGQLPIPLQPEKPNFPPAYAKRVSFSARPSFSKSPAGIDISQIGHPRLIQSSQDIDPIFPEPKAAYIRGYKGDITAVAGSQIANPDSLPERIVPYAGTATICLPPTVELAANPPAVQTVDSKKRQNAPKLSLQTSTAPSNSISNNITSTTVAGLPTNIYVPPTPSRTGFGDMPFTPRTPRRMEFGLEPQLSESNNLKSPLKVFSPPDFRVQRPPPPKERYRFSDPTTPTPASVRSIRSLSWNGLPGDRATGLQNSLQSPISPQQFRSPMTIYSPRRQNLIPRDRADLERESMQTHPHSRITSSLSTEHTSITPPEKPHQTLNKPKLKITPANEDDILTEDDASIIESECDSGDESSTTKGKMFTHNNRSSIRTARTHSTRFSQDSIPNPPLTPFYGEIKDGNPFINKMDKGLQTNRLSAINTPTRTLSSPGIEIVTRPGDESPPLSPVTFRIDTNPGPMTPKLPYKSEPYDRIEADKINDGSYPLEWKVHMERQAAEEDLARRQHEPRPKSLNNGLALPPKNSKRKSVSFHISDRQRDSSDEKPILPKIDVSLAETMRQIRPSFYKIGTNDSDISMI
ncbi:hypothetical protein TWF730_010548 [Orbilia blumenaviensis]|uniref:Uncharacterized protein n=1 Tax=Orbilia blumenaviensis TaxID=1796055 RepID=A0AAV9UT14_9PEZI